MLTIQPMKVITQNLMTEIWVTINFLIIKNQLKKLTSFMIHYLKIIKIKLNFKIALEILTIMIEKI